MRERKPPAPERPGGFSIQKGVRGIKVAFFKWFKRASEAADVSRWLEAGADLNARDENGLTPLHRAAAFSKTPAVVNALLEAGADLNARMRTERRRLTLRRRTPRSRERTSIGG